MRLCERDKRDREDFEEWKALPINERYAWKRIAITGIVIVIAFIVSTNPYAAGHHLSAGHFTDFASAR
jgi:hypothetical protein